MSIPSSPDLKWEQTLKVKEINDASHQYLRKLFIGKKLKKTLYYRINHYNLSSLHVPLKQEHVTSYGVAHQPFEDMFLLQAFKASQVNKIQLSKANHK